MSHLITRVAKSLIEIIDYLDFSDILVGVISRYCAQCFVCQNHYISETRMHSSGIYTTRLLTVSQHALHRGCIPACTGQGGIVCLPRGCTCPGAG